jgi:hypothetical protein
VKREAGAIARGSRTTVTTIEKATQMTTNTITGLYDTYAAAEQTIRDLKAAGISDADISLVGSRMHEAAEHTSGAATGAETGATIGGVAGAGAGILAGLGLLAIPGVGPVVAAGWLVATAVGAVAGIGAGAATGGIIGAMTDSGISHDHAHLYAEGIRRGGTLVTARVDDSRVTSAEAIMNRHGRVDMAAREGTYRDSGWNGFDEKAPPYTPAERLAAPFGTDKQL